MTASKYAGVWQSLCPLRMLLCGIALAIVLGMLGLHFGLVGIGQWSFDEFSVISSYRDQGLSAFASRLWRWSPRPISEILIWIYGCLVNWTHRPLVGLFLGLLWLTLLSLPLISFVQIQKQSPTNPRSLLFLALFSFGLIAFFLLGHNLGSLFYSPVISAAYLTTLSGITLCFFQIVFDLTERNEGRVIASLALITAGASSETGAVFAIIFGLLSLNRLFGGRMCGCSCERHVLWFCVPGLVGTAVICLLILNRQNTQEALFPTREYHNIVTSLRAGAAQLIQEFLTIGNRLSTRGIFFTLLLKACLFIGFRYCWLAGGVSVLPKQRLALLILAIIGTAYISAVASYYGYGGLTNGWHQEMRQCLIIMLVASIALFSCHYQDSNLSKKKCEWIASVAFCIAMGLAVPERWRGLVFDYRNYSACVESRIESWNSGLSDSKSM
ncbi:MAG: hypothetical protein JO076_11440, partial [Verrucomicrobia bacterium]|nr:hypothetical protein [Verrucomicrobiota bacterium]